MSVTVGYNKSNRLVISGLKCDCPCSHNTPTLDIYVGSDILKHLAAYVKRRELGDKAVLVADETTYAVAGETAERALRAKGIEVTRCILRREGRVEPDESAVGEVLMTMRMDTEFFVSVGSGAITDITRTVAAQTERPFVAVATAPSMDGYTSSVAPLLMRGVKIHVPAVCPELIVCDLDILRTAPEWMFAAGVGDVLGKYIAKADWTLGLLVNGEEYCPTCAGIVIDAVQKLLDNIPEIKARSEAGAKTLIEALLLAGITVMIIGTTRAVGSVEHNVVHYWDMQRLSKGELPTPHGLAVGVSTRMLWPAYENFRTLKEDDIDEERALSHKMSREQREKYMIDYYGGTAARQIMDENEDDFLSDDELLRRVRAIRQRLPLIREELSHMPPLQKIEQAMRDLGAPMTPEEVGIDAETAARSLVAAKDYRSRYSLLKAADEIAIDIFSPELSGKA